MTLIASVLAFGAAALGFQPHAVTFPLRGQSLELHVYGQRGNPPIVLASGDGGR